MGVKDIPEKEDAKLLDRNFSLSRYSVEIEARLSPQRGNEGEQSTKKLSVPNDINSW